MLTNATCSAALAGSFLTPGGAGLTTITPQASGSMVFTVMSFPTTGTVTPQSGMTAQGALSDATSGTAFGIARSTSLTTAGVQINSGFSSPASATVFSMAEVQQYGSGTVTLDGSSPAAVSSTASASATTAAFTPPAGSLILALAAANGNNTTDSIQISSSVPLNWVLLTEFGSNTGAVYTVVGIWAAIMPPPPMITTTGLPGGMVGVAYSSTMRATTGTPAYTWSKTSGSLPTGLSLNASTGVISGTPTTAGTYNFTIQVTDATSQTALVAFSGSIVINTGSTPGGVIPATWALAAEEYTYGTLAIPVSTNEHDWLFVSVSWAGTEEQGIAYCSDNVHNFYEPGPLASSSAVCTQVFVVPNARAASEIYVSTSAYARWLSVQVTDVAGLQPGYTVDFSFPFTLGSSTGVLDTVDWTTADFILAVAALTGAPQTITQSGTGATWTALTGSFNGNASSGVTQALAWCETTGTGSGSIQFNGLSGNWSNVVIAVYRQGGLPPLSGTSVILDEGSFDLMDEAGGLIYDERGPLPPPGVPNPAFPVISCQAAFGYTPQQPTVIPTWTDITNRYLGLSGQHGRSFELEEISAADMTLTLDNRDGALSPQNTSSPFWPNVTLVTPVRLIATWQGRTYTIIRGLITAIPQTYDFQRGIVKVACSDDFSKLAVTLLATAMIQEQMYDNPLNLWPLNDQQGAPYASNWSGRSAVTLVPTQSQLGPGGIPKSQLVVGIAGKTLPVNSTLVASSKSAIGSNSGNNSNLPTTGFGNANSGIPPGGLAGSTDTVWGNASNLVSTGTSSATLTEFQATILMDANDNTLPLTSTGATYSVWVNMTNAAINPFSFANILTLSDSGGFNGKNYLTVQLQDTTIGVAQTAGTQGGTFSPGYDGAWHLWTVTITTAGVITLYIDAVQYMSFTGTFPTGSPTYLQWGGDSLITPNFGAGLFTGCMMNASVYDSVVDIERIRAWYMSGTTGFLDEDTGTRLERILSWARWSGPQAIDQGVHRQQQLNYLTGGYASAGVTGAVGNYATAGGSIAVDTGAQADMTLQDIANTECGLLALTADGTLVFRNVNNLGIAPVGLALGDMDYPLNSTVTFENGLGEWVNTTSCTVAQSPAWSYDQANSALMTVTGTPSQATVSGGQWSATAGEQIGFSCWVMSPQGCFVAASINWYGNIFADTYQANYTDLYGIPAFGFISSSSSSSYWCPPMTPVFIQMAPATAPANTLDAQPAISIGGSPATGTQLYFDHARMSPAGFQVPYLNDNPGDLEIVEDIQYLFNDIAVTRNADQVGVRVRDATSRSRYFPRVFTRTIFSSPGDPTALTDAANTLLSAFKNPALRVEKVTVDAACNPEAWPFVLSADVGDTVSFTRTPIGGAAVTGSFIILSVHLDLAPNKAQFSYILTPSGVF